MFLKKFGVGFAVLILLFFAWGISAKPVFYGYSENITFYSDKNGSDGIIKTVSGAGYIFILDRTGESFSANIKDFSLSDFLKDFNAKKVFEERWGEEVSFYYYSDKINYCKALYGKKVNIQVSEKDGKITVGTPLIYGSY